MDDKSGLTMEEIDTLRKMYSSNNNDKSTDDNFVKAQLNRIKVELPSWNDIEQSSQGEVYYTDVCLLTCGDQIIHRYFLKDIDPNDDCNISYIDFYYKSREDVVEKNKRNNYNRNSRNDFAIRLALDFSKCPELFDYLIKSNIYTTDNISYVKFGWYTEYTANNSMQHKLNNALKAKELKKLNNFYTFDKTDNRHLTGSFKPINYPVYEYLDGKYIRMKINQYHEHRDFDDIICRIDKPTIKLNDGSRWAHGEYIWIKVSELTWEVNEKTKRLLSRHAILSGIQYMAYDSRFGPIDYYQSNINWYINTYLKPQLLQFVKVNVKELKEIYGIVDNDEKKFNEGSSLEDLKSYLKFLETRLKANIHEDGDEIEQKITSLKALIKEKEQEEQRKKEITKEEKPLPKEEVKKPVEENEKKKELTKLLEEIRDSKKYYLGNEDINKLVKEKYNSYIKELDELKKRIDNHDNSLVIKRTDPNYYYERLISELNDIVEKLREHSVKVKPIHEMLEILNECRKSTIDVNKDSLCKTIDETNNIILGLNVDQKTKSKLISRLDGILANNIERNKSYINAFKKNINAPTKTLDELKEELTKDLKPFNDHLNNVNNCNIMLNILLECQKDKIDITKDPICNSVNNVKSTIFKFILLFDSNIKDNLNTELESILNKQINQVTNYLNDSLEGNSKSITLEDMKTEFATDFQPFLEKLKQIVDNIDVVNIILTETQEMIDSTFTESKVAIAASYMDNINEIVEEIKNIGSSADMKEVKKLRSKLKQKFNVTESKDSIITTLREYIGELHKLRLIIMEKNKKNEAIAKAKVDVDIEEILNSDTKTR